MAAPLAGSPIPCPRCGRAVAYRRPDRSVVFSHKGLEGVVASWGRLRCPRNVATATPEGPTKYAPCGGWAQLDGTADEGRAAA